MSEATETKDTVQISLAQIHKLSIVQHILKVRDMKLNRVCENLLIYI
jgi:hypothetical protein